MKMLIVLFAVCVPAWAYAGNIPVKGGSTPGQQQDLGKQSTPSVDQGKQGLPSPNVGQQGTPPTDQGQNPSLPKDQNQQQGQLGNQSQIPPKGDTGLAGKAGQIGQRQHEERASFQLTSANHSCTDIQYTVQTQGQALISWAPGYYYRFVADPRYCSANQSYRPGYIASADMASCFAGYVCE
jgi:hypothetical protein